MAYVFAEIIVDALMVCHLKTRKVETIVVEFLNSQVLVTVSAKSDSEYV